VRSGEGRQDGFSNCMTEPKLHHYVPRFYLNYFLGSDGKLWIYDKETAKVFSAGPNRIAAESQFYRIPEALGGHDPLAIEKSLSELEGRASVVVARIVRDTSEISPGGRISISGEERVLISEYLSVQYFRTLELRELLLYLLKDSGILRDDLAAEQERAAEFKILAEAGFVEDLAKSIHEGIWIFAKNTSPAPFITSDHPICIQSSHNGMWVKGLGPLKDGQYLVFPMTPQLVLYCKEPRFWSKLEALDSCISPVVLDSDMVDHENTGQAFMASRFLVSCSSDFEKVRAFIPTIGTHMLATDTSPEGTEAVERAEKFLRRPARDKPPRT